jgi:hypothetical protein
MKVRPKRLFEYRLTTWIGTIFGFDVSFDPGGVNSPLVDESLVVEHPSGDTHGITER